MLSIGTINTISNFCSDLFPYTQVLGEGGSYVRELEEGNLLEVGEDLLQLLLGVEERVEEGDSRRHAVRLHPQACQVLIGNVSSPCGHLWRETGTLYYTL